MAGPDPAPLVMKYLETESRNPDGSLRPASIVILQDQEDLNDHTLPYYAEIRNDPFTFTQLYTGGRVSETIWRRRTTPFTSRLPTSPGHRVRPGR